jgi:hypothetical protein
MCQLSFHLQLMRCKHFDTCNGALLAPESSHVVRWVSKFAVGMDFHVLLLCSLAEQNQFFCNPPCRDNVLQRITVDAAWIAQ